MFLFLPGLVLPLLGVQSPWISTGFAAGMILSFCSCILSRHVQVFSHSALVVRVYYGFKIRHTAIQKF